MKKSILFCTAFFAFFFANAQFETVIIANDYGYFLRTLKGDFVMIGDGKIGKAFSSQGDLFQNFEVGDPVGGYWSAFDLSDTSVVFSGGAFSYEGVGGWQGTGFYQKFNSQWEQNWFSGGSISDIVLAEKMPDDGFVHYYPENLARFAASGYVLWNNYFPNMGMFDVTTNANLQTIATSVQGLLVVDSMGFIDSLYADYNFTQVETISFGNLVAAKSDTIYLFSSDFEVIQRAPIPGQVVKAMKSMESKVAVLTETNHVYLFDQDLLPLSDFQIPDDHLSFKNIVPDTDGIVLAGNHQYGVYPNGHAAVFIKKYGVDGFDSFAKRDIGLQSIQPGEGTEVWPQDGKYKVRFHDFIFQVFNYSDTILNSFSVNIRFPDLPMEWPLQPNPIPQHFSKQFNNLNLEPGQSLSLIWDEFTATFVDYPSGTNLELCFWSSMPDGKSDINPNNDVACADFFVATKEKEASNFHMEIYPNPTTDNCLISFNSPQNGKCEITVTDLLGRTVQSHKLKTGTNAMNITGLENGIYLIALKSDGVLLGAKNLVKN